MKTKTFMTASLGFAAWLLLLLTVSCGETAQTPSADTSGASPASPETAASAETEPAAVTKDGSGTDVSSLPADLDFGGAELRIRTMVDPNVHSYADVSEESGDVLDDAIYRRNRAVEEGLHLQIAEDLEAQGDIRRLLLSGDETYTLCSVTCPDALTYWIEGLILETNSLPYVDLTKNYYAQKLNRSISLKGKNYVALGAFDVNVYDLTYALTFNKGLVASFDLEDPYTLVGSGAWTIEKMDAMMRTVLADVDGDGAMTDKDRYGYLANAKMVLPDFWIAAGVKTIEKDPSDIPVPGVMNDRFVRLFDRVYDVMWDSGNWFSWTTSGLDVPEECITVFSENRGLFLDMSFFYIEALRGMDVDFGVIPYPKFDETQEDYNSRVSYYWAYVVPNVVSDPGMAGAFLEEANRLSAEYVIPAYCDIALKGKYSRDEESVAMLDLILDSRVVDLGDTVFCDKIRDGFMYTLFRSGKRDLSSEYAKNESVILRAIEGITENASEK